MNIQEINGQHLMRNQNSKTVSYIEAPTGGGNLTGVT